MTLRLGLIGSGWIAGLDVEALERIVAAPGLARLIGRGRWRPNPWRGS